MSRMNGKKNNNKCGRCSIRAIVEVDVASDMSPVLHRRCSLQTEYSVLCTKFFFKLLHSVQSCIGNPTIHGACAPPYNSAVECFRKIWTHLNLPSITPYNVLSVWTRPSVSRFQNQTVWNQNIYSISLHHVDDVMYSGTCYYCRTYYL